MSEDIHINGPKEIKEEWRLQKEELKAIIEAVGEIAPEFHEITEPAQQFLGVGIAAVWKTVAIQVFADEEYQKAKGRAKAARDAAYIRAMFENLRGHKEQDILELIKASL